MLNDQKDSVNLFQQKYLFVNLPEKLRENLHQSASHNGTNMLEECLLRLEKSFSPNVVNTLDFLQENINRLKNKTDH